MIRPKTAEECSRWTDGPLASIHQTQTEVEAEGHSAKDPLSKMFVRAVLQIVMEVNGFEDRPAAAAAAAAASCPRNVSTFSKIVLSWTFAMWLLGRTSCLCRGSYSTKQLSRGSR